VIHLQDSESLKSASTPNLNSRLTARSALWSWNRETGQFPSWTTARTLPRTTPNPAATVTTVAAFSALRRVTSPI
jgi:hypothetical protein